LGREQNLVSQKRKGKLKATVLILCWDASTSAIVMNFGMQSDIANEITHTKFYVNQFRGFKSALLHRITWPLLEQINHGHATL